VASQQSSTDLIADRYASALYELSSENKCVDKVLNDLINIQELIKQNKDFNLLIKSPLISSKEKLVILKKILSKYEVNSLTSNFINTVSTNKRMNFLSSIISRYNSINSEKRGDVFADVTSADILTTDQKNKINNKLSLILGKKLSLNFKVDKKIIGGLIVKVGSIMIDSSLSSKIKKLSISMGES